MIWQYRSRANFLFRQLLVRRSGPREWKLSDMKALFLATLEAANDLAEKKETKRQEVIGSPRLPHEPFYLGHGSPHRRLPPLVHPPASRRPLSLASGPPFAHSDRGKFTPTPLA